MFLQNVSFAFRLLKKNKLSFSIAILGLALSLAASIMVASYFMHYWSYDQAVSEPNEWYRLRLNTYSSEGDVWQESGFYIQTAGMILHEIPQVKDYIIMQNNFLDLNLSCESKRIEINDKCSVSANLPAHYKMRILYGNPDSLLVDKSSLIISQSFSKRYFGDENPVGKVIAVREMPRYVISGVFEDLPQNLHLRADIYDLLPASLTSVSEAQDYILRGHIRIKIPDPHDVQKVQMQINSMLANNAILSDTPQRKEVELDALKNIHFIGGLKEDEATVNPLNAYAVMLIGILILFAALLNFINIMVLSWQERRDEFATRRAVGSLRCDLFAQLLTEYSCYFMLAIILAGVLYLLCAKIFYSLVGFQDLPGLWQGVTAFLGMLLILGGSGVLAAFRFSGGLMQNAQERFQKREYGVKLILFLELTIGFLFISLAAVLGAGYFTILNRDPGFEAGNTLQYKYITMVGSTHPMYYDSNALRDRIRALEGVKYETATNFSVVTDRLDMNSRFNEALLEMGGESDSRQIVAYVVATPPDFFEKRNMQVLSGKLPAAEENIRVVVNQSFAKLYGADASVLGKTIRTPGSSEGDFHQIAAVINDAWYFPAHIQMVPLVYILNPMQLSYFQITYEPGKKYEVQGQLDDLFEEISSRGFFGFRSLDVSQEFKRYYQPETTYVTLTILFAMIICAISLMGIYAVSALQFQKQRKNIAIRKVCGASFRDVLGLLFKSYVILFVITAMCGILSSFHLAKLFFKRFAIMANYPVWILPGSVFVLFLVLFLPLYFNSRKAWEINPIQYLQSE